MDTNILKMFCVGWDKRAGSGGCLRQDREEDSIEKLFYLWTKYQRLRSVSLKNSDVSSPSKKRDVSLENSDVPFEKNDSLKNSGVSLEKKEMSP